MENNKNVSNLQPDFDREAALQWWKKLKSNEKLIFWREFQKVSFTPSHSPEDLTGREIELIWKSVEENEKKPKRLNRKSYLEKLNQLSLYDKFEASSLNLLQLPLTVDEIQTIVNILKDCRDRNNVKKIIK